MNHYHWSNDGYAQGFFGDILDIAIKVSEIPPKKEAPKPKTVQNKEKLVR